MSEKVMKALWYEHYGGGSASLKRVEVPIPKPNKNEVLVKLEAAAPNPIDCKIQDGMVRPFLPHHFPYIPVTDIAGEVVEVGSEIKTLHVGDKVVAMLEYSKGGGLAQYAVASEKLTVRRPDEVSAIEGAGLPLAGLTALYALTHLGGIDLTSSSTGKAANILITAASGGVGHYAVQLAKLGNNHITATCGARNIALVKSLGADEVLDYMTEEGAAMRSPSGRKYDIVIHCAHNNTTWSTFKDNLTEQGKVIDLNPDAKKMINFVTMKLSFSKKQFLPLVLFPKERKNLEFLVNLIKEGKMRTVLDSNHPFKEAEQAWAKMMGGHAIGKIIIES